MVGSQKAAGPSVSVVIPAYNAENTIAATIDSVLTQSHSAHEIIVVNDGSRDRTAEVLAEFGSRIKVIQQSNQGLAIARRTAVEASTGDVIALLDADDICCPERLAVQAAVLRAFPDVALCASEFSAFNEVGPIEQRHSRTYFHSVASATNGYATLLSDKVKFGVDNALPNEAHMEVDLYLGDAYRKLAHGNFLQPPTIMFPRWLIERAGSFEPESGNYAGDWDFIVRASMHGRVAFIDRPLINYRRSSTQISSDANKAKSMENNIVVLKRTCQRDPELFAEYKTAFTRQMGSFHLAVADGYSGSKKWTALRMLLDSLFAYRYVSADTLRVVVKILLPKAIVAAAKMRGGSAK